MATREKKLAKPRPKARTWIITIDVTRVKQIKDRITAKQAIERAREFALFDDEMPLDRDEITDITAHWVDKMGVQHLESCLGTHCRHYGCQEAGDDVPWFCTTCDPDAQ